MIPSEPSSVIQERVIKARRIQSLRFKELPHIYCNAQMPDALIDSFCTMETAAKKYLFKMMDLLQLSVRSYTRILKVSRTIADLSGSVSIEINHVAEALHFRSLDKPLTLPYKKQKQQTANKFPNNALYSLLK